METSFDLLAWRASLVDAAPVPSATDLIEWAGQLVAAGADEGSALLLDVAALHQGFSPQAKASRQSGGLSYPFGWPPSSPGGMLDRAHADLRDLAVLASTVSRQDAPARPTARPDIADIARTLRHGLEQSWNEDGEHMLAATLPVLMVMSQRRPALDYRTFAGSPLSVLVPVIATVGLIDFALQTRDLWDGTLGSPHLLHQSARLDSTGLGPYLGNVGHLVRDTGDLIDLARVAQGNAAQEDGAAPGLDPWISLLLRGCRGTLFLKVVDDLGDLAAGAALSLILDRVASRPDSAIDQDMVKRLRDAGLDNADYVLATRAQEVIVRVSPQNRLEGAILGSIEASGGDLARAEATFRYWLARFPDDTELHERLAAAEAGRFDRFALHQGFGSPEDRQDMRLRRRGALPDYPRRRGERMRAVDVG